MRNSWGIPAEHPDWGDTLHRSEGVVATVLQSRYPKEIYDG